MRNSRKNNNTTSVNASMALVIVAAGSSSRMGGKIKKEYLPLNGGTVLSVTARIFLETANFDILAVAVPSEGKSEAEKAFFSDKEISGLLDRTKLLFVTGGTTRQESVRNALEAISDSNVFLPSTEPIVLVHDGARPFVTPEIITAVAKTTRTKGAAVPVLQPVDTQKEINQKGIITRHLLRKNLAAVQTPQGFLFFKLLDAHRKADSDKCEYTDDTEIWNKYVSPVQTVPGAACNRKITYPEDIRQTNGVQKMIRTGLGYDIHPLVPGRKLLLGGIQLPFNKGEAGHSDGDVLFHAITDAVLGASGLGDIGSFFPPSEEQWKDADSSQLLEAVWKKITDAGWQLGNIDCVIALENPKFLPYRDQVRSSIAKTLNVDPDRIFVKAKTGEKMGKIGRSEAVEAWAVCLLEKNG